MKKSLKNSSKYFLRACLQPMGIIIMIFCIRNFHIIYDRFPLPIFNNSILLVNILFIRGIYFVWLKSIVLLINIGSIISDTSILTFFLHPHPFLFFWQVYERHTRSFILLVLLISFSFSTRSRT